VEDFLVETVDMSRTKRKQVVDKLAAQHILQGALDYLAAHA
jgi:putative Holliday junction resolvase